MGMRLPAPHLCSPAGRQLHCYVYELSLAALASSLVCSGFLSFPSALPALPQ